MQERNVKRLAVLIDALRCQKVISLDKTGKITVLQ